MIPLLERMGFKNVRDWQSAREFGKDILYFIELPSGRELRAIQLKVGDIICKPGASGKERQRHIQELVDQARLAVARPISVPDVPGQHRIAHWTIATTGKISELAIIVISQDAQVPFVDGWDGRKVVEMLQRYWPDFFLYAEKGVRNYSIALMTALKDFAAASARSINGGTGDHFVMLPIADRFPAEVSGSGTEPGPVFEYQMDDLADPTTNRVLLGDAYSGKSTLLHKVAARRLELSQDLPPGEASVPVLLTAQDLLGHASGTSEPVEAAIRAYLNAHDGAVLADQLVARLNSGTILVLIDEMHRITSAEARRLAAKQIAAFADRYAKTRVLVATRMPDTEVEAELVKFRHLEVGPFGLIHVEALTRSWCAGRQVPFAAVVRALEKLVAQGQLPSTPLSYTLALALFDESDSEVAFNFAELVMKYLEVRLGRWDRELQRRSRFPYNDKLEILTRLAQLLHETGATGLQRNRLEQFVDKYFEYVGLEEDSTAFVDEILDTKILTRSEGQMRFSLMTFQEFLAGRALQRGPLSDAIERHHEHWWGMPIIVMAGLNKANEELIRSLIEEYDVRPPGTTGYYESYLLGAVAQNSEQASKTTKLNAIQIAVAGQTEAMLRLESKAVKYLGPIGRFAILAGLERWMYYAIGSPRLATVYRDLFAQLRGVPHDDLARQVQRQVVASIMADYRIDGYIASLDAASSASDTRLLLLVNAKVKALLQEVEPHELTRQQVHALQRIQHKTARRLSERSEHVKHLFTRRFKALPPRRNRIQTRRIPDITDRVLDAASAPDPVPESGVEPAQNELDL